MLLNWTTSSEIQIIRQKCIIINFLLVFYLSSYSITWCQRVGNAFLTPFFFFAQVNNPEEVKNLKRRLESLIPKKRFLQDVAPSGGLPTPQPSDSEGEELDSLPLSKKVRFQDEVSTIFFCIYRLREKHKALLFSEKHAQLAGLVFARVFFPHEHVCDVAEELCQTTPLCWSEKSDEILLFPSSGTTTGFVIKSILSEKKFRQHPENRERDTEKIQLCRS